VAKNKHKIYLDGVSGKMAAVAEEKRIIRGGYRGYYELFYGEKPVLLLSNA